MLKHVSLFLLFIILSIGCIKAQSTSSSEWIVGPTAAYQYQSKSFLKLSFWGLKDLGYADYLKVEGGANFTWQERKTFVVPELGVTYYLSAVAVWPFMKAEVTPYTVSPKIGLGVFNLLELGLGYGWALQSRSELGNIKGLNISIGASFPLRYNL